MLPLLSMSSPIVAGVSVSVNRRTVCARPSSMTLNASWVRPLTYAPFRSLHGHVQHHELRARRERRRLLTCDPAWRLAPAATAVRCGQASQRCADRERVDIRCSARSIERYRSLSLRASARPERRPSPSVSASAPSSSTLGVELAVRGSSVRAVVRARSSARTSCAALALRATLCLGVGLLRATAGLGRRRVLLDRHRGRHAGLRRSARDPRSRSRSSPSPSSGSALTWTWPAGAPAAADR